MWLGRDGFVPQPTRMFSPRRIREPCAVATSTSCGSDEPCLAREEVDAVALQLVLNDVELRAA